MAKIVINATFSGEVPIEILNDKKYRDVIARNLVPYMQTKLNKEHDGEEWAPTINWIKQLDGKCPFTAYSDCRVTQDKETVMIYGYGETNISEMIENVDDLMVLMFKKGAMYQEIITLTRFKCLLMCAKEWYNFRIPNSEYKNYCRYDRKYGGKK